MSKLHVPEGVWLVCSKGMRKQQLKVTSHNKVTMAGGRLKATIEDGPDKNFICGAMAVAGAIIGAIVGALFVAGTVASGGALAIGAGATMAAAAAGGAAAGGLLSLVPCICAMLLKKWTPYDTNVLTAGYHPLLENSQTPCRLGGTVIIMYSEKAADEMTDITIGQTVIGVVGTIATAYLMGPALSAIGTTACITKATILEFGWGAGLNYLGGFAITSGTAYGVGWGIDKGKDALYGIIPTGDGNTVKDYINGFETDPLAIIENTDISKSPDTGKKVYEHVNDLGGASGVGQTTIGNRVSQYEIHEQSASVRLDDIEEHGATTRTGSGRIDGSVEGRNPSTQTSTNIANQDYGGRYQEIDRTITTTNSQYNPNSFDIKSSSSTIKNSVINSLDDNFGKPNINLNNGVDKGGFYIGLLQDAYKGISNFILKGQAKDLQEALKNEEAKARAKITVLAGKD
ncbi:DUF4280 domain-containing protein [Apibacter muscae]|uniref:DUF4280 domain-containing protein n=1 Tax=Apibacter muscae TaxID=2509004 RepID=A0A563DKU1_9FLAO|nr:PAAR-like protein [Apibacter muscae]TWP30807.1 DUF4280 domain-containing protein [Apibacter muscae]